MNFKVNLDFNLEKCVFTMEFWIEELNASKLTFVFILYFIILFLIALRNEWNKLKSYNFNDTYSNKLCFSFYEVYNTKHNILSKQKRYAVKWWRCVNFKTAFWETNTYFRVNFFKSTDTIIKLYFLPNNFSVF